MSFRVYHKDLVFYDINSYGEFWMPIDSFVASTNNTIVKNYSHIIGMSSLPLKVLLNGTAKYSISSTNDSVTLTPYNWTGGSSLIMVFAT